MPAAVCHRPDGLEDDACFDFIKRIVCHRPDGLEELDAICKERLFVCHRPDGLEVHVGKQKIF